MEEWKTYLKITTHFPVANVYILKIISGKLIGSYFFKDATVHIKSK